MGMTNPGPILAERETLHDGEPIYDLAWGPDPLPDPLPDPQTGNRRRFPEITLRAFSRAPAGEAMGAPSRQASLKKVRE